MGILLKINTRSSHDLASPVQQVDRFNDIRIHLQYDSIASTFEFTMPFDPENRKLAELVAVSHMHECSLYYVHDKVGRFKDINYKEIVTNEELLITGTLLSNNFGHSSKPKPLSVGGYSRPGSWEDTSIPLDKSLESNGKSLKQIINYLLQPSPGKKKWNFKLVVDKLGNKDGNSIFVEEKSADEQYEKTTAETGTNFKNYLTMLASQKNIILSHSPQGDLLITAANFKGSPILDVTGVGTNGVLDIDLNYNGQELHSEISVVRQSDEENGNSAEYTILNPLCPILYRPLVLPLTSGNDITIDKAARNALQSELRAITLTITLDSGVINNRFITVNQIITITDSAVYLYDRVRWIIQTVDFQHDHLGEKCVLQCVLPCVFGGPIENPFSDPHLDFPARLN